MKPHTAIGIATVIFYSPITLYAQYIGIRCWKYGSRMACYMIMAFTISMFTLSFSCTTRHVLCSLSATVRLAGGALLISVEKDLSSNNAQMIKATYVLINLGIVPLLAAYDGLLARMYAAPPLYSVGYKTNTRPQIKRKLPQSNLSTISPPPLRLLDSALHWPAHRGRKHDWEN